MGVGGRREGGVYRVARRRIAVAGRFGGAGRGREPVGVVERFVHRMHEVCVRA